MNLLKGNVVAVISACSTRGHEKTKNTVTNYEHDLICNIKLPLLSYNSRMQKPAQHSAQRFS